MRTLLPRLALVGVLSTPLTPALADEAPTPPASEAPERYGTTIRDGDPDEDQRLEDRPTERTTRRELEERQPRSTPEALRFSPGVYVQQTAHGQGSAYIRGATGRRTLLLFDGLRLNHALFRMGPNQYLFSVDSRSVDSLEVVRGSASVELGANAISGAVRIRPLEPRIDPAREGLHLAPLLSYRYGSADGEQGARVQLDAQLGQSTGLLTGVGFRRVGQLRASGPIQGLKPASELGQIEAEKEVPRFEDDGRTQLGTGYDELSADARLVHRLSEQERLVLASYIYRQFDAPRTDQCPPPETPDDWCLRYEEQFRTHSYGQAHWRIGGSKLHAALSFQRQHERRRNDRGETINGGRDDINVWEARFRSELAPFQLSDSLALRLLAGADGSYETVSSAAWTTLSRSAVTRSESRGQYVEGSRYSQGGGWLSARLNLGNSFSARAGARATASMVDSPADPASSTRAVSQIWPSLVGNAGLAWRPHDSFSLLANLEQGFRPPNLDDLTARQLTGQGRQIENPNLQPERALTAELGIRWASRRIFLEGWLFQTRLDHTMERRDTVCPELDRSCQAARRATPFMLTNLEGTSILQGGELKLSTRPMRGLRLQTTLSYAWGEGDSPLSTEQGTRRPLSRVPPLNGSAEARWQHSSGVYLGGALRWARAQDRLSYGDTIDARIPFGGTPGYAVFDLRAGLHLGERGSIHLQLENLTDVPYRMHGSSINGPERSVLIGITLKDS